jgi:hypothetical protein
MNVSNLINFVLDIAKTRQVLLIMAVILGHFLKTIDLLFPEFGLSVFLDEKNQNTGLLVWYTALIIGFYVAYKKYSRSIKAIKRAKRIKNK